MEKCVHILVSGRVQGVYFRASARERALELGLRGIVRNRRDGQVEIVAKGSESSLERFLEWCRHGPAQAQVDDLLVEDWTGSFDYEGFTIAH
ncbi:MAG: acylphosphatase [Methylococcales bacterium]